MSGPPLAATKLVALLVGGVVLVLTDDLRWLSAAGVAVAVLALGGARLRPTELLVALRPVLVVLTAIVVAQGLLAGWGTAAVVGARVLVLVLAATTVTLTTPVSDLLVVLETALAPLRVVGVDPTRAGLVLAMTIRFVPLLGALLARLRDAQRARGRERPGIGVVAPLLIATLRFADDLGDALEARGVADAPGRRRRRTG